MAAIKKYFEKKVSLLSTSDVRYDGELYTVDPSEQSIALKHVNCMGTEGRRTGDQAIAPSDCTYEFIIFRAVNIRELWLDEGNGRKRDLTDEILIPLRSGQNVNYSQQKQRQDMYDQQDHPKRKVGYQSRSSHQQQSNTGYADPYYQQAPQYDYNQQGYGGNYAPPEHAYPPLPNQGGGAYGGYQRQQYNAPPPPPQNPYYDTPNQQGYYPQSGYNQRGYQRQRPPQYYNQQRAPQYYNQGQMNRRYQQNPYYNQQRRYPQQYNRSYQSNRGYQQNRYNRSRNQQRSRGGQGGGGYQQAGTGAFLDNRRLRGDEIDVKDQQDFDFGAARTEFDQNKDEQNGGMIIGPPTTAVLAKDVEKEQVMDAANQGGGGDDDGKAVTEKEETKEEDHKKYDPTSSFFDGLKTETKKSKPKQDTQQQKEVDAKTFGTVAATYKSRHINRSNQRNQQNRAFPQRGYQRNYSNYSNYSNYNNPQRQQRNYSNNYQPQRAYSQQYRQQGYTTNKWIRK